MKKRILLLSSIWLSCLVGIQHLPEEIAPSKLFFDGYVKLDAFLDSRQVANPVGQLTSFRDGELLLWPQPFLPDCHCHDINARPQSDMLPLETCLAMTAIGPEIGGAAITAYVETDFFGVTDPTLNTLRMRHGFLMLDWSNWNLLFGQTWNPLFVEECFPYVVSYNMGAPFNPFSFDPQIRITKKFAHNIRLKFTAFEETNFFDYGPLGPNTIYLRDALVPRLNLHLQQEVGDFVYGAQFNYKRLVPRLVNDFNCVVHESFNNLSALAYVHWTGDRCEQSFKFIFGQNDPDILLWGAYAVHTRSSADCRTYVPLNSISTWYEICATPGRRWQPGLFVGYQKNLGTPQNLFIDPTTGEPILFGLVPTLDYAARVSPRIRFDIEPLQFALEIEMTRASFGQKNNNHGKPVNTTPVNNVRILFAAYYYF